MPEEHDEFNEDLEIFLNQSDRPDQITWIEGNRAGATDRLPVQGEEKDIAIPKASTRAALEQVLRYTGDKVMWVVVAFAAVVALGLCSVGAFQDWLEKFSKEKKKD